MRQRGRRGWTENDLWNLDAHLCHHLGSMLVAYAGDLHTYPPEMTCDAWVRALSEAGGALVVYDPHDEARVRDARHALHWIANNLVDLRD